MQADQIKWNKRFEQKALTPPSPPASVVEHRHRLKPGRVLDVASGDGAVSLFLAQQAFEVIALDISDVALSRLNQFATALSTKIKTIKTIKTINIDLDAIITNIVANADISNVDIANAETAPPISAPLLDDTSDHIFEHASLNKGTFDSIVTTHFKPHPALWAWFVSLLKPGGTLLLSTFNMRHHHENGFSRRFCLEHDELVNIHDQLMLDYYDPGKTDPYIDTYLFKRRSI